MDYNDFLEKLKPRIINYETREVFPKNEDVYFFHAPWFPRNNFLINSQKACDILISWIWILIPSIVINDSREPNISYYLETMQSKWFYFNDYSLEDMKYFSLFAFENKDIALQFKLMFG